MNQVKLKELGISDEVESICACFQLRKAARAITQLYDTYTHQAGVTPAQFSLLMIAFQAGELSPSAMAARAVLDRTTLTRNIRLLEQRGLIAMSVSREDRRAKVIAITAAGIKTLKAALPHWEAVQRKMVTALGKDNYDRLMQSLDEVVATASA